MSGPEISPENTAAKTSEAGFLEMLAQDLSNEVFKGLKTDLRKEIPVTSRRKERHTLSNVGVLAVIIGALLSGEHERIAYLLLGLVIGIVDLVEVKKAIEQKKTRVSLMISSSVMIGAVIQLMASIGQTFDLRQLSLLIVLMGGLFILIDRLREYSLSARKTSVSGKGVDILP